MIEKIKHNNLVFSSFVTVAFLQSSLAYAQNCGATTSNLAEITQELDCEISTVPTLLRSVCYIMGIGFTIAGLLKLKEYVDDPNRSFMKDALIRLGVGAMLIFLPWVIVTSAATFGAEGLQTEPGRQDLSVFN